MGDDITVAVKFLTVLGAAATPLFALLAWLIRKYLVQIAETTRRTEAGLNHVEVDICDKYENITIGQRIKRMDDKQDTIIAQQAETALANDQAHARLWVALGKLPPDWLVARLAKLENICGMKRPGNAEEGAE